MPDALRAFIADCLDPISVVLGLLALVPIVWTWWDVVFGRRRRERRWFADIRRRPGERPAILIVDLLSGKDVRASVENFCLGQPVLAGIAEDRILVVQRDTALRSDDMSALQEDVRGGAVRRPGLCSSAAVVALAAYFSGSRGVPAAQKNRTRPQDRSGFRLPAMVGRHICLMCGA